MPYKNDLQDGISYGRNAGRKQGEGKPQAERGAVVFWYLGHTRHMVVLHTYRARYCPHGGFPSPRDPNGHTQKEVMGVGCVRTHEGVALRSVEQGALRAY
jgi:hypothetical protein